MISTPSPPPTLVIVNDVGLSSHHGSKMVTARLVDGFASRGFRVLAIPAGTSWRDHEEEIDRANVVVVNGEGTLHHSAPAAMELMAIAPYCQSRAIPVFLVNSVWQDNSRMMAQQAKSFSGCFVRESRSQQELATHGVTAEVVPDLVVGWPEKAGSDERSGLLVTDSVNLEDTGQLAKLAKKTPGAHFTTLHPAPGSPTDLATYPFRRLERRKGPGAWSEMRKRAYRLRGDLYQANRRRQGQQVDYSLDGFFEALSSSQLLITGRYHAVCMALVTRTPFFALGSNSHKVESMLDDAGLSHRLVDLGALREAGADQSGWDASDDSRAAAYCEAAKASQEQMFDRISQAATPSAGDSS